MKRSIFALTLMLGTASRLPGAASDLRLDLGSGVGLSLKLMEVGTFRQGSPASEAGRSADETQRNVTLTVPFYIGVWQVTVAQFRRFSDEGRYRTEAEVGSSGGFGWDGKQLVQRKEFTWKNPGFTQSGDDPVTLVTWNDAKEFCRWLSGKTGRKFTLPTEAQWEYACRAGTQGAYPTGEDAEAADLWAWHSGNSGGRTHPSGQKQSNAWGLFDMGGNAWEWCEDWYGPYTADATRDPLQTNPNLSDKPRRVLRGGSWLKDAKACRSAARFRNDPRSRNADNGFRVVTVTIDAAQPPLPPVPPTDPGPAQAPNILFPPASDINLSPPESPAKSALPKRGFHFAGLLCLLSGIAVIVLAVLIVVSRVRPSAKRAAPTEKVMPLADAAAASTVRTRLTDDGFWIQATVPAGTPIAWRCEAGGKAHAGSIAYEPGPQGQFIFLGQRPTKATAIVAGTSGRVTRRPSPPADELRPLDYGFAGGTLMDQIGQTPPRPSSSPPQDFPPAY